MRVLCGQVAGRSDRVTTIRGMEKGSLEWELEKRRARSEGVKHHHARAWQPAFLTTQAMFSIPQGPPGRRREKPGRGSAPAGRKSNRRAQRVMLGGRHMAEALRIQRVAVRPAAGAPRSPAVPPGPRSTGPGGRRRDRNRDSTRSLRTNPPGQLEMRRK